MKKIVLLSWAIVAFTFAAHSQDNKPKVTYRVGTTSVKVWETEREGKFGTFIAKDFKIENSYKKDGKWMTSNTFDLTALLQLRAAIDKTISEEGVKIKEGTEK